MFRFEWAVNLGELSQRSLEVTVKNHVALFAKGREKMGEVVIDLSQFDLPKPTTVWSVFF